MSEAKTETKRVRVAFSQIARRKEEKNDAEKASGRKESKSKRDDGDKERKKKTQREFLLLCS